MDSSPGEKRCRKSPLFRPFLRLICLLFLLISSVSHAAQMPLWHWAYSFIERMEAKGVLSEIRDGSRPFSRQRMAQLAQNIYITWQGEPDCLTAVEYDRLIRLLGELYDELPDNIVKTGEEEKEPHLFSWKENHQNAHFDLIAGGSMMRQGKEAGQTEREIDSGYYGGILRAHACGMDVYSDNRILSEWGSRTYLQHYNPSNGYPTGASRDSSQATWDESNSYLMFQFRGLNFVYGRDRAAWGPSRFGGLMLSGLAHDMDMLKITTELGCVRFTYLHGELRSDFNYKWLAGHRLEISFHPALDVGVHEAVIYGNRDMELAYWNPVLPFLISEHTLGDQDNVTMGFDWDWHPGRGVKWYGELFIDDLFAPWELFDDYYGNKFAVTTGLFWVNPIQKITCDMRAEYTRIEPFVYTHKDAVNVFEHYDDGLGHALQPNSDQIQMEFRIYPSVNWTMGCQISYMRHGTGHRRRCHLLSDGETKAFLTGVVERRAAMRLNCSYEWRRDLFIQGTAFYEKWQNQNHQQDDNPAWPGIQLGFMYNW